MSWIGRLSQPISSRISHAIYRHYFEVIAADTPELMDTVYRLRYQVYVEENGFERAADFPDRKERDEFDSHSLHMLLRHRRTKVCIGTARAILSRPEAPLDSLPIQRMCDHPLVKDPEIAKFAMEFSRLAVSKERLKQSCDSTGMSALFHFDPTCKQRRINTWLTQRIVRYLSVGLMAGVIGASLRLGHPILFAVMEPFLLRNLRRIGWDFPYIDEAVEHRGRRHPCGLPSLYDAFVTMQAANPSSWRIITHGGRSQQLAYEAETASPAVTRAVARAKALASRIEGPSYAAPLAAASQGRNTGEVGGVTKAKTVG